MPDDEVVAIARVPLARSRRRMLAAPLVLLLIAATAAVAGLLLVDGWQRYALVAGAALPVLLAGYLLAVVATVRLDVEVSTLRLRWIGVDRRYALARGAVTRVPLRGERAARLRPRFGAFGWGLGRARLRGEETIQLVRMARSPAIILVPTEAERVGVAPRSEEQFLRVLAEAARVQQRLDQVAARARAIPLERPPAEEAPPEAAAEPVPLEVPRDRPMTGIERALLEERLAEERAAALAAAEAERRTADEARRQVEEERLAAARAADAAQAPGSAVSAVPETELREVAAGAVPSIARPRIARPSVRGMSRAGAVSMAVAILPLVAGAAVWGAATWADALRPSSPDGEIVVLALALAGPAAALAGLAARAWFPRLVGLITITAACALVLIGRAIFV